MIRQLRIVLFAIIVLNPLGQLLWAQQTKFPILAESNLSQVEIVVILNTEWEGWTYL